MAAFTYQGTIQFRRQTAAQWTAANVVLAQGELGLELDTKNFKMGDGVTAWTALAYGGMSSPNGTTANVGDNSTLLATTAFVATAVSSAVSGAVVSFNTRTGAITLTSTDVTTALGYNPANMASPTFTGTVTSGSFSGSGSGLTGTAASLSIGGNAATATMATNNAGGAANQIRYQTGTNTSSYITAPSIASTFLEWNGSAFVWASVTNGTVTSIAVSGGTTGLTTSGGPITTSGTITLGGTLAVANGGTGSTTASSALTALGAAPLASPTFTGTVTIPSGAVISGFAPLASPVFTGSPTVPGYLTSAIAATTYAPLASPALTGVPIAPTATVGTNTTQLATTAFATAAANATVTTFNTRAGAVTLAGSDVTTALGFTPYNATNPSAYISANQTITATGDATGSGTTSIALTLASVGSAGTYSKVTTDAKGRVISGTAIVSSDVTTALGFTPENAANKGIANGYASLDSTGKLTSAQIPASLIGAVVYQGTWNATTNIPALVSSTGTKGYYYKVSVAGTTAIDGNSQWVIGDTIIFDGSVWDKIDGNAVEVISVAGRTGVVTLSTTDVSGIGSYALLASPALTGTPTAPTATAGTNTTQLATTAFVTTALPTSNSQLTNGAGYVTALTAPVTTVAGRTGTITLAVADVSGAAPLASAALTGSPTAPTATAGTNTTQLATTAFVTAAVPTNTNQLTNGAGFITSAGAPVQTVAGRTGTIVLSTTDISGIASYAPLASPVLTGTPTVPTATAGTTTTQAASTAFVGAAITAAAPNLSTYAPIASPALTGVPVAPTAIASANSTQLATTAFVNNAVQGITAISLTNANVTLSAVQYNSATILMTGTLTGNVTITFPASGNWTVLNETTGAFTVTLVATTGGSIVLPTACAVIIAALSTGLIYANSIVPATILESPNLAPVSMGWLAQVLAGVNTVNVTGNMSMTSDQCAYSILLFEGSPSSAATITLPTVPAILGTTDTAILWNQSGQTLTFVSANGGGTISLLNGESCSATLSNTYGIYLVDQVAPTPPAGDNSHKIATTAFVQNISSGTNIVSISGATTLNATQYSYACLQLTGTLSATATITLPNSGWWTVMNLTTGGYPVILSTGSGTTVTLTNNDSAEVIANATGVFITTSIANTPGGDNDNSIATTSFVQAVPYRRNRILNGRFQIWQRGVAWTTPASGTYLADKWRVDYTGTSAGTFTIGQALVHTQPAGLSAAIGDQGVFSWNQTGTPNLTSSILSTRVEGAYVLSGQTCTVSFEMALGAGSQSAFTVGVNIAQCPGTGGSPSATITSTTQNFTVNSATFTRFTATFTLPTMNGTYGTNGNDYVAVQLVLPNSQLYSFYLTEVQLETGDVATPFMVQNPATELEQCMRFFQKTLPTTTVPTYGTGILVTPLTINQNLGGVAQWANWSFDVPMRGLPAVTLYTVASNATPYWSNISGTAVTTAAPSTKISASGVSVGTASSMASNVTYIIHAIADADL